MLEEKLENLPSKPGVYLFKDAKGKVIYVGKAKSLKNRVRTYFQKSSDGSPKLRVMTSKICDLETIVTDSEVEALILEANLIKEYKPRYNITLKDDKSYPYIRVTNEKFPRIFPTRKIVQDGSRYFGPYTDVHSMRSLLKTVRRIFPIRSCNYRLDDKSIKSGKYKVCLDYYIKRCPGPCEGLISEEEYRKIVNQVVSFIDGKNNALVEELKKEMEEKAAQKRFEEAARIRDQINFIEVFQSKQKVVSNELVDRDILTVCAEGDLACGVLFKVRDGKVVGRQHFYLNTPKEESSTDVLSSFLKQYYLKAQFIPGEIFLPEPIEEMDFIEEWLTKRRKGRVKLVVPQRGEKAKLMRMCQKNAELLLEELKLQKMKAKDYLPYSVKALQKDLHLPKPPRRIEAFDISTISGSDAVASMVAFVNGRPHKSDYRKFKIKTVEGIDDFAMMAEVIYRRYSRLLEEKAPMPDLILVDGGKGQLSSALSSLEKLNLKDQPIVALAKRLNEVYLPGLSDPQSISKSSPGLKLLMQIRDEAHRFAIQYHRKLRGKRTVSSELDEIKGVGEVRKRALLKHFGSLEKIKEASVEQLSEVEGISRSLAEEIWRHFHKEER